MKPIRILHVIGGMGGGGAESMIMNLYRHIDRTQIQFDFVVHTDKHQIYDDEIEAFGGKIFHVKKFNVKNFFSYKKWWLNFFKEHPEYSIVHGHIGSSAAVYLSVAKKFGRIAIAHSHNTRDTRKGLHPILWRMVSFPTRYIADYFFACSKPAAIDRFGSKIAGSNRCQIFNNAIDTDRFAFSQKKRDRLREELGLESNYIVGHVGRFSTQKNHVFLIKIFEQIYKKNPSARLLLIGGGDLDLMEQIKTKCCELKLDHAVIFTGVRKNTEDYYSAMDVFCFPSLFEGLPVTLIEAQNNGLPCILSDVITSEADMGAGLFHPVSLDSPPEVWADLLLQYGTRLPQLDATAFTVRAGFSVRDTARQLQEFYIRLINRFVS